MVGYSGNYIMASPNVNGNTYLQYGILFDAIGGPAGHGHVELVHEHPDQLRQHQ